MDISTSNKPVDKEMKINLAALRKFDEFVLDILETSSQVAVYKFNPLKKEWERTEVEGSIFLYRRSTLPKFGLMIMNRLSQDNFSVHITKEMEFKVQKPFLLYKNSSMDIQGIWFNNSEKCEKVGELITKLYTSPVPQQESTPKKQLTGKNNDDKNILAKFSAAQQKYNETKSQSAPTNDPSSQTGGAGKLRSKSLSIVQPSPPYRSPVLEENAGNDQQALEHDPCIIRSSSAMKPSSVLSQSLLSKSLPNSAKKTPRRQLFTQELTSPFPSQLPTEKIPFPSIPTQSTTPSLKAGNTKSGLSSQKSGSDITLAASLMTPLAFQSSKSNHHPETPTLTKEQLQETLLYLLQKDSEFLEKIHTTYLKNASS